MSIKHLPEDVIDKIKSSVVVTSLNGVIAGLLTNSLDAGATKVNISVDYTRGNCTVEDNGLGISPDEFKIEGGLGKLHHTSRFPPISSTHGKHGDFLASLATLSLLSIVSRHKRHISHNSISIHNSQTLSRHLPAPPEQRLVNFDHGTRVTVRDLFGSLPVRVKQRAAFSERTFLDKEWTKLIREVVALLLAWSISVTVTLRDTVTQRELRLRPPDKIDTVSRVTRLLTQASLADPGDVMSWIPISAASGSITIQGCICTSPVATRRTQFISLGIHPLPNEYGTDVLYEEVNRVFSNSSFGVIEGDENQPENPTKLDAFTGKELRSRKGIERWPMFYLKITATTWTDYAGVDEKLDARGKDLAAIVDLLKALCYGFLKKQHLQPRKVHMAKDESLFSTSRTLGRSKRPSKRQKTSSSSSSRSGSTPRSVATATSLSRSNSPFDGWDRVKVGKAMPLTATSKPLSLRPQEQEKILAPLIGEGGKLLRKPFDEPSPELEGMVTRSTLSGMNNAAPNTSTAEKQPSSEDRPSIQRGNRPEELIKTKPSEWLQKLQASWINPVFETAEAPVPQANLQSTKQSLDPACCGGGAALDSASMTLTGRISKEALSKATVISQVDRKFILVKLPLQGLKAGRAQDDTNSALIILDQHAADERCRLEDLMNDYFAKDPVSGKLTAKIESLGRPLTYEVSSKEFDLFKQHENYFANWGICYKLRPRNTEIVIIALPPSILERCRLEPRLLIETLRKEIWRMVDDGLPTRKQSSGPDTNKPWITNFHGCPKGILELLHSRACRSAIMFNDILTEEDCESLITRLAQCAFPFQCAHGRPSMVPLLDLGLGERFGGWRNDITRGEEKWKRWMRS